MHLEHLCSPPLTLSSRPMSSPCWRSQSWVWCHNSGAEWQEHPCPAGHMEMTAFLGFKCALSAHVELLVHQHPQVFLLRVCDVEILEPACVCTWDALALKQDLALGFVGPRDVHPDPPPSLPRSLRMASLPSRVTCTTQLGVMDTHHGLREGRDRELSKESISERKWSSGNQPREQIKFFIRL